MATLPAPRFANTTARYGGVAKTFHWLTALLVLTAFPLGLIAYDLPYDTSAALAAKATMFSMHKTVGVMAFAVGLARIAWAFTQPRPALLNAHKPAEARLADLVHWLLYSSLVIVPLSGWLGHAASSGFAPIWWPFGQTLPFVPQSDAVAAFFGAWHWVFTKVLGLSVILHIAGAIKHHVIDKDATLRRMLPGVCELPQDLQSVLLTRGPLLAAAAIWAVALTGGTIMGLLQSDAAAPAPELAAVQSEWVVQDGALSITVQQLGTAVTGQFADWTADITFDPDANPLGQVAVTIAIASLSLGGVTPQALEPEFFNAAAFQTATFSGPIIADGDAYAVDGTLILVGQSLPVRLPFTLELAGDRATATGQVTLDRRDFGMGPSYPDESGVGFSVVVDMTLTAQRASQ